MAKGRYVVGALAVGLVAFGGYQYLNSPSYLARQQLKAAEAAVARGELGEAAELFAGVAKSGTGAAGAGQQGLRGLLTREALEGKSAAVAVAVIRQAVAVNASQGPVFAPRDLVTLGGALVDAKESAEPGGAWMLLKVIAPIAPDQAAIAAKNERLLERVVAVEPANIDAASELAQVLEKRNDCGRCEAILKPHAGALGEREGARILGQIYAGKGEVEASYRLLLPYTEAKLKAFSEAQARYNAIFDELYRGAFDDLRAGKAGAEFYARYDRGDEETRNELVGRYVDGRLEASPRYQQALKTVREAAAIVPAALDLGVVMVQRAQTLDDPKARTAQFEAAEKTFLAISSVAGDSDDYRMYLGQVYYWLGKQDEGKRLFDELIAANGRAYGVLISVAGTLREVGAIGEARAMAEEAYGAAKTREDKWFAAHVRSVMATDPREELTWLERADLSDARVNAARHSVRASLALEKGQRAEAKRELEQAAAAYGAMPESASQRNSAGLTQLSLYAIEGEHKYLQEGLRLLDEALALKPSDSILLMNNISAISSAAIAGLVGDTIDLRQLKSSGDLSLLYYLYDDAATRDALSARLMADEGIRKVLAYGEKAALLAPRSPSAYGPTAMVLMFTEDEAAMRRLAERVSAAQLDLSDLEQNAAEIAAGKDLDRRLERMRAGNQQAAATLAKISRARAPATWAVAAGDWINGQNHLARWGQPVDADEVVKVARQAQAAHPSAATSSNLLDALTLRAALRLADADPAFAAEIVQHGRAIDFDSLLVLRMNADPAFLKLALANADVQEQLTRLRERDKRYPDKASAWAWMLFRNADAAYAETLAQRLTSNRAIQADYRLRGLFGPRDPEAVISRYMLALAGGNAEEAKRIVSQARADGVPLPRAM